MTRPIKPEKPAEAPDSQELDALETGRLEAFVDVRERLAKLEGKAEYLATKHEVERLRSWFLRVLIISMVSIFGLVLSLLGLVLVLLRLWPITGH